MFYFFYQILCYCMWLELCWHESRIAKSQLWLCQFLHYIGGMYVDLRKSYPIWFGLHGKPTLDKEKFSFCCVLPLIVCVCERESFECIWGLVFFKKVSLYFFIKTFQSWPVHVNSCVIFLCMLINLILSLLSI